MRSDFIEQAPGETDAELRSRLEMLNREDDAEAERQLHLAEHAAFHDLPELARIMLIAVDDDGASDPRLDLGVRSLCRIFCDAPSAPRDAMADADEIAAELTAYERDLSFARTAEWSDAPNLLQWLREAALEYSDERLFVGLEALRRIITAREVA